jgi:DNA-binding transcriptional LysR family regulator
MVPLHFKHLETFYWVARLGSFTGAAEQLHSTQSTISMRISELEARFGVALFERTQRKVQLTSKGEELLIYAERFLQLVNEIQQRVSRPEIMSGIVRIGVAEVVAQTWLPDYVRAINQRYPKVTVRLEIALTFDLIEKLRSRTLDVILSPGRLLESGFVAQSLGTCEFRWLASPSLGLPKRSLTPSDLQKHPILVLPRESYHYVAIEQWFRANKAHQTASITCNSIGVIAALTASGCGVSLLPPICHGPELDSGKLTVLKTNPPYPPVEFFAIKSADQLDPLSDLVANLAVEISTFHHQPKTTSSGQEFVLPRALRQKTHQHFRGKAID